MTTIPRGPIDAMPPSHQRLPTQYVKNRPHTEMKTSTYLRLRKQYIIRSRQRVEELTDRLERLSDLSHHSKNDIRYEVIETIRYLSECSKLLQSDLKKLEYMPPEVWGWTACISNIERLWNEINHRLTLLRTLAGEEPEVLHSADFVNADATISA